MALFQEQHGIRSRPISAALERMLNSAASSAGVDVHVYSGGQPAKGSGGRRTGSTRHDLGNAADLTLTMDGRTLREDNPKDLPFIQEFVRAAVENGATGIGAGAGYMGPGKLHVGFDRSEKKGAGLTLWGPGETSKTAPKWLHDAVGGHALAFKDIDHASDPFGVTRMQTAKDAVNEMAGGKSGRTLRLTGSPGKGRMSGPAVAAIGQKLAALGYDVGTPADTFGPKMQAAVRAYQSANGLKPDGIVGPRTFAALSPAAPAYSPGGGEIAPPAYSPGGGEIAPPAYSPGGSVPPGSGVGDMPGAVAQAAAGARQIGGGVPSMPGAPPPMGYGLPADQMGYPGAGQPPSAPSGPVSVPTSSIGPDPLLNETGDNAVVAAMSGDPSRRVPDQYAPGGPVSGFGRSPIGGWTPADASDWTHVSPSKAVTHAPGGPVSGVGTSPVGRWAPTAVEDITPPDAPPLSLDAITLLQRNVPNANDPFTNWQRDQTFAGAEGLKGAGLTPYSRGVTGAPAAPPSPAEHYPLTRDASIGSILDGISNYLGFGGSPTAAAMPGRDPHYVQPAVMPGNQGPELFGAPQAPLSYYTPPTGGLGGLPQYASAGGMTDYPNYTRTAGAPGLAGGVASPDPVRKPGFLNTDGDVPATLYEHPSRFWDTQQYYTPQRGPKDDNPTYQNMWKQEDQSFPQQVLNGGGGNDTLRGGLVNDWNTMEDWLSAPTAQAASPAPQVTPAGGQPYMYNAPASGSGLASGYQAPAAPLSFAPPALPSAPQKVSPAEAKPHEYMQPGNGQAYKSLNVASNSYAPWMGGSPFAGYMGGGFATPSGGYSNSPFTPMGYSAPNFNPTSGGSTYAYNKDTRTYVTSDGRTLSMD